MRLVALPNVMQARWLYRLTESTGAKAEYGLACGYGEGGSRLLCLPSERNPNTGYHNSRSITAAASGRASAVDRDGACFVDILLSLDFCHASHHGVHQRERCGYP